MSGGAAKSHASICRVCWRTLWLEWIPSRVHPAAGTRSTRGRYIRRYPFRRLARLRRPTVTAPVDAAVVVPAAGMQQRIDNMQHATTRYRHGAASALYIYHTERRRWVDRPLPRRRSCAREVACPCRMWSCGASCWRAVCPMVDAAFCACGCVPAGAWLPLAAWAEASVDRPQRSEFSWIQRITIVKRCNGCSSRSGVPSSLQQFRHCAQRHGRSRTAQRR